MMKQLNTLKKVVYKNVYWKSMHLLFSYIMYESTLFFHGLKIVYYTRAYYSAHVCYTSKY